MATHPIYDDQGATDDRGSRGGHLRSNEVTSRFSSISRDRMDIQTRKWCKKNLARRAALEDIVHVDLLGSSSDLGLTLT